MSLHLTLLSRQVLGPPGQGHGRLPVRTGRVCECLVPAEQKVQAVPGRGRLPTKGSHEDKTPRVARNPLPAWAAALSGTTGDLRSHTSSLSSTSVNGMLMTMEKHYAKRGHVSHGGGALRLQYTEPLSASNKPLVLGMWVLTSETRLRNHPTKSV